MRFLCAEGVKMGMRVLQESGVHRIAPGTPIRAEIGRDRVLRGDVVIKAAQLKILPNRPLGIGAVLRGSGGEARALLGQLGTIGLRPVPEKRQHARLQIGNAHECGEV